mmetsp:Transcript_71686/g.142143  ORF Transcript_71686/g.142143 Transcript_71686/m.142143 type:complete len:149 (-) Transcript_71686:74-520(-)
MLARRLHIAAVAERSTTNPDLLAALKVQLRWRLLTFQRARSGTYTLYHLMSKGWAAMRPEGGFMSATTTRAVGTPRGAPRHSSVGSSVGQSGDEMARRVTKLQRDVSLLSSNFSRLDAKFDDLASFLRAAPLQMKDSMAIAVTSAQKL